MYIAKDINLYGTAQRAVNAILPVRSDDLRKKGAYIDQLRLYNFFAK